MRRKVDARVSTRALPFVSRSALLLALVATAGCPEKDHRVPYRANEPGGSATTGTRPVVTPAPATAFQSVSSVPLAPNTTAIDVDGARIAFGEFEITGTLVSDFDRDSDRDALLLLASPVEQAIGFARREGPAFAQSIVTRTMLRPDCTRGAFEARTLSADLAVVTRATICGAREERELLPLVVGATPSLVDGLRVLPIDADTPWVESVRLEPTAEDVDGDGSVDFVIVTRVVPRGLPETTVKLVWPNLPSGLALDRTEPARTLATATRDARGKLARSPARAAEKSGQALAIVAALCREHGIADVATPSARGIPCGDLPTLGRLLAIRVAALIAKGSFAEAHEALRTAGSIGIAIDPDNRKLVTDAIAAVQNAPLVTWRALTEVSPSGRPDEAFTTLAFEDEATILVRAASTMRVRLGDPVTSEQASDAPPPMTAPSGTTSALEVRTSCHGDVATLLTPLGPASVGLSRVAPFDPSLPCEAGTLREGEPGRYTPLGLTNEGLVVALGRDVALLPLDANGRASAPLASRPASSLGDVRGGAITRTGTQYALSLEDAVVLRDSSGRFTLLRGDPFASPEGPTRAVALGPSGRTLAVLRGRTLWLGSW